MPGPHPVVGIATKFPNVGRGSSHQTDVFENFGDNHIILVAFKKGFNNRFIMGVFSRFLND